jgi:hypothetical protein
MAELLIFMENRDAGSHERTSKFPQRGDMICAQEDGWAWGDMELGHPFFLVVMAPGSVPADYASLLSHEAPVVGNETAFFGGMDNTLQYRGFFVDVDSYTGGVLRAAGTATVPKDEVLALKTQRPPLPDPKIVGQSERIIG